MNKNDWSLSSGYSKVFGAYCRLFTMTVGHLATLYIMMAYAGGVEATDGLSHSCMREMSCAGCDRHEWDRS